MHNIFMGVNYSLTIAQVAEELGCTKSYAQRLIKKWLIFMEIHYY